MAESNPLGEMRALQEYWELQRDPVIRGQGIPHGARTPVVVLPGLFGNDLYLQTLRHWLHRIGYQPVASHLPLNAGCPKRLSAEVQATINGVLGDQQTFAIVGHSRGGLLAKVMATRFGARVSHLVVVGSPLGGMLSAGLEGLEGFASYMQADPKSGRQALFNAGKAVTRMIDPDCDTPTCGCEYIQDLMAPPGTELQVTSIYSAADAIVPPAASVLPYGRNIEVEGSHGGLMFNRQVYPHIATALAG